MVPAIKSVSRQLAEHIGVRIITDLFRHIFILALEGASAITNDFQATDGYIFDRKPGNPGDDGCLYRSNSRNIADYHISQVARFRNIHIPATVSQTDKNGRQYIGHCDICNSYTVDLSTVDRLQ